MTSPISPEAKKVLEETVSAYPKRWTHGICAYTGVDREKGTDFIHRGKTGDICHAGLNGLHLKTGLVVNAHREKWAGENKDYLLWVARESPFSHGVLNRKDEKELCNHAMVIDLTEVGHGGALWLCKAMRYFVEDNWKPETFRRLREAGLDGLEAFIGASILDSGGAPMGYSHVNLVGYETPGKLRKVYDELRATKRLDTCEVSRTKGYFKAVDGHVWGSLAGKKEKKPDGWGGFIEVDRPCDPKEYAEMLKEIFEGDPSNVG